MGTTDSPADELKAYLSPDARGALHGALDLAYQDVGKQWNPEIGWDTMLFGYALWRFKEFRLAKVLKEQKFALTDESDGGQYRIGFGHFLMGVYSCGFNAPEDPWKEFPNNDNGASWLADLNSGQTRLRLDGPDERQILGVILAHYGNYQSGLEALYLKIPARREAGKEGGRILEWSYVEPIWQIGTAGSGAVVTSPTDPRLPGAVKIEKPALPFKPIKKRDTGA